MGSEILLLEKLYLENCSIPEEHCSTILQSLHSCIHLTGIRHEWKLYWCCWKYPCRVYQNMGSEILLLEKLYLENCSIPEEHCSTILQSLHSCIHLKAIRLWIKTILVLLEISLQSLSKHGEKRSSSWKICILKIVQYQRSTVQQSFSLYIYVSV